MDFLAIESHQKHALQSCILGSLPFPLISAIVLNYKTPQHAVRCVQALRKQTIADKMEILVVDNHSEDDSIGVLRNRLSAFPEVRIIETPENLGFGAGYNLGIHHARGKYLLINNPAKLPQSHATERLLSLMEKDESIGIAGPKLMHDDGTVRDSYRAFPSLTDVIVKRTFLKQWFPHRMQRYLQTGTDPDETRDVDWVIGGCLMIRRDLAEKLHGFDPQFFLFFEDIDLCRRCWAEGKRVVYYPEAVATDRKRRLSEGGVASLLLKPVGRAHIASAVKYFWKWRGVRAAG